MSVQRKPCEEYVELPSVFQASALEQLCILKMASNDLKTMIESTRKALKRRVKMQRASRE